MTAEKEYVWFSFKDATNLDQWQVALLLLLLYSRCRS